VTRTATGCRQPVSGEDVAFHDLSAGLFTLSIRQVRAAGPALFGIRWVCAQDLADHPGCRTHAYRCGEAARM